MNTKDIVNISLFTTLLSVCAWIYIPMTIPFTMQTFAVFLAMLVLGGKKGTIVILIYLLLGTIGVPVFSGGTAGIGSLFGPTGGYMIGWIFLGLIVHLGDKLADRKRTYTQIIILLLGLLICYLFGTLWYTKIYAGNMGVTNVVGFVTGFTVCVVPFIIPDILKLFLAFCVSKRIRKYIQNV